jgi:hypothetical protein
MLLGNLAYDYSPPRTKDVYIAGVAENTAQGSGRFISLDF